MKYCQFCGNKMVEGDFCSYCGKGIGKGIKPKKSFIIYSLLSLILGVLCFIPSIYVSNNNYMIAGAHVRASWGDNSELEKWRTLETIGEFCSVVGLLFVLGALFLGGIYIYKKRSDKNE